MTPEESAAALALVAAAVDVAYYLGRYPDVAAAGAAAAEHYFHNGWREHRDPAPWFDTRWYLDANPDVRSAEINPLWHYLIQGRMEGRLPRRPGGAPGEQLARTLARAAPSDLVADDPIRRLSGSHDLLDRLRAASIGMRGLVVAVGHDDYQLAFGGSQLVTADEQQKCNGDLFAYLHVSPEHRPGVEPRLALAPPGGPPIPLSLRLDGRPAGYATWGGLTLALSSLALEDQPGDVLTRVLVVHSLLGHRPEDVATLAAWAPDHAFFWAHDYAAGCESVQLLRNGHSYCHAPPLDSMACRICTHGQARAALRPRMEALFRAIPFHLLAPSEAALDTWTRASRLPYAAARVHPHAMVVAAPAPDAAPARHRDEPVVVGFVGQRVHHKGWPLFEQLALWGRARPEWRFVHIGSAGAVAPMDGVRPAIATAIPTDPGAVIRAIAANRVDLVVVASPWPETFCLVAHEAVAAGADVVCVQDGGHVPALIRRTGRGVVAADGAALLEFFTGGAAAAHVAAMRMAERQELRLARWGTAATVDPAAPDREITREPFTHDPALRVLVGGLSLLPRRTGNRFTVSLPGSHDGTATVLTRHGMPAWTATAWRDRPDPRRLGLAIASLWLDDVEVPQGDSRRLAGWHAPEDGWTWTDGRAEIAVGDARVLAFEVRYFGTYCVVPWPTHPRP